MSRADNAILRGRLRPGHIAALSVAQHVEINVDQACPEYLGPLNVLDSPPVATVVHTEHELITKVVTPREYRWYCVASGVNFSGVCCGADNLALVVPLGRRGTLHAATKTCEAAERLWLKHYYAGQTNRLQALLPVPVVAPITDVSN
jgi:hypothetical protein